MARLRFVLTLAFPLLLLSGCEGGWFGNTQWGDEGDSGHAEDVDDDDDGGGEEGDDTGDGGDDTGDGGDDTAAAAAVDGPGSQAAP